MIVVLGQVSDWMFDEEQFFFVVVIYKEGVVLGLVYEYLVVVIDIEMQLCVDLEVFFIVLVEVVVCVEGFVVDDFEYNVWWQSELFECELIFEEFVKFKDKDCQKICCSMLFKKQFDVVSYLMFSVWFDGVFVVGVEVLVMFYFEFCGESVVCEVLFFWLIFDDDGMICVDFVQSFIFCEFGIKFYFVLFGVICVVDMFDVVFCVVV